MTLSGSQNPQALFPADVLDCSYNSKPWQVAHVKSRREKVLAHYLADMGISYYLPLYKRRQFCIRRVRYSLLPLFNGYLFFKSDDFDRYTALCSNQIIRIIDVRNEERLVKELRNIYKVLSHELQVYPYDFVTEGQKARIKKGPLKGVEGIIIRKGSHYRLVLSVTNISMSMSVVVDSGMIEPAV